MKKTLFAAACAVATLAAAPAFAEATGFVGASVSKVELDTPFGDLDGEAYGLAGSITAPIASSFQVQFDGSVSDSDDTDAVLTGTVHLAHRTDSFLVGGFVGGTEIADEGVFAAGAEAEGYFGDFTAAGSATYLTADDIGVDGWSLNADGRYFINDNLRVNAGLGYLTLDADGIDVSGWTFGLGGEYQFAAAPVSVFGGWNRLDITDVEGFDADVTADTISIGIRWNFGGSLKTRDRSGASLSGIERIAGGLPLGGFSIDDEGFQD